MGSDSENLRHLRKKVPNVYMKDTVESRAVKIAARVMQAAGLCRYESATQCKRLIIDETTCDKCIRSFLLAKARKELKKEGAK